MTRRFSRVALIGRQNVGKSALFNMILGEHRAVVSPIAGTTRDATEAQVTWRNKTWLLSDSGGIEAEPVEALSTLAGKQAERVLERANLVCFVVDGKQGLTMEDTAIARLLRRYGKTVVLAVNKLDNPRLRNQVPDEILALGFSDIIALSAKNGTGTGDLLDAIASKLAAHEEQREPETKLIILGRPNAGKSSLLNRILNEERVLVSPEPHTTRDPQDAVYVFEGRTFRIIDTAGIRRQANLSKLLKKEGDAKIEQRSVNLALQHLERADIALIILDLRQPITAQDRFIVRKALDARASIVLVGNKWDCIPNKQTNTIYKAEQDIRKDFPFVSWAPFMAISAKEGQRVFDLLRLCGNIAETRAKKIGQLDLNRFMEKVIAPRWPIRNSKGTIFTPRGLEQVAVNPPTFRVRIGKNQKLPVAYQRFLVNTLRQHFHFTATPIHLEVEKARKP